MSSNLGGPSERRSVAVHIGSRLEPVPAEADAATQAEHPTTLLASRSWWPGWLWLGGTTLCISWGLTRNAIIARRHRKAAPVHPGVLDPALCLARKLGLGGLEIRTWENLRGPIAFGIARPRIGLPPDWSSRFTPTSRDAMLAHELAHLAARDPLLLLLADWVCALAWWHPMVWWARRQLQAAMELSADEASSLVPDGPSALAETLVRLGRDLVNPESCRGLGVAGTGFKSELAGRVVTLLGPSRAWQKPSRLATLASAALTFTTCATTLLIAQPGAALDPLTSFVLNPTAAPAKPDTNPTPAAAVAEAQPSSPTPPPATPTPPTDTNGPAVLIEVRFFEDLEGARPNPGPHGNPWLAKLFPAVGTSDPPARTVQPTGDLPGARSADAANIRIDLSETDGQTAVIDEPQLRELRERLKKGPGLETIAMPRIQTRSGVAAMFSVGNLTTLVTGVGTTSSHGTNGAAVNYRTEPVQLGATVEIQPDQIDGRWRIGVKARVSEFLGYDDPGPFPAVTHGDANATPLTAVLPLPRLRQREASGEAHLAAGESLLLRGPIADRPVKVRGGWFRRERTEIQHRRLYILVTPGPTTIP